jgi:UDP-N-acetylmuramoylalanine--D-glutamate ligase
MSAACYDERPDAHLPHDLTDIGLHTGPWDATLMDDVDRIVTSPGFPPNSPPLTDAAEAGIPVVAEAAFGLEGIDTTLVAVTGTNGKSTVVAQTADMLRASGVDAVAAGNIGEPLSDIVDAPEVLVAELSSFQLAYMDVWPKAATILNIAPDHLDWHRSMEAYVAVKASVLDNMANSDLFVANANDTAVMEVASGARCRVVACSSSHVPSGGNGVDGDLLVVGDERYVAPVADSSYRFDLIVAASLAVEVGASPGGVAATIEAFTPGDHRRNVVADLDGVRWINDSKATNPHAAVAAAGAYQSVRLLAGGRNKGLDLSGIGAVPSVKHIYAFGESAQLIAGAAKRPVTVHATMADAMAAAGDDAEAGDVVLLSPGCTSFDEFTSYAERGRRFEEAVHAMKGAS